MLHSVSTVQASRYYHQNSQPLWVHCIIKWWISFYNWINFLLSLCHWCRRDRTAEIQKCKVRLLSYVPVICLLSLSVIVAFCDVKLGSHGFQWRVPKCFNFWRVNFGDETWQGFPWFEGLKLRWGGFWLHTTGISQKLWKIGFRSLLGNHVWTYCSKVDDLEWPWVVRAHVQSPVWKK